MAVTREQLLSFLSKKTRTDLSKLGDDDELFSTGVIDSFAMVDLLMWLEKQTGARLDPGDISIDNFDTVSRIIAYAAKRKR